jgi:hypothetical protein
MKSSRTKLVSKLDLYRWSRRQLLSRGVQALSVLALPSLGLRTAWAQAVTTFDFYISTSGSDSAAGTLAAPWAITSLQAGNSNNSKISGKRVGLIAGTYDMSALAGTGDYQNPVLHLPAGSTSANTYVGSSDTSGNYSARAATLSAGSYAGGNSMIGQNQGGGGNFTIDGLAINANNNPAGSPISYFPGGGAGPITVQNCYIYNVGGNTPVGDNVAGMFQQGASGTIVSNNYFYNCTHPNQEDHGHAFEEYSCSATQFIYNTVMSCSTGMDGKENANNCIIAYNYFYNCTTGTIQGYDGASNGTDAVNTFHHNVIDSCGQQKQVDVASTCSQPVTWYNNTCYDTRSGSVSTIDLRTTASSSVKYYNNIDVMTANSGGPGSGVVEFSSGGYSTVNNNCYYFKSYSNAWGNGTSYSSLASWQKAAGTPDLNSITSNPSFASSIIPGSGPNQFQLAVGSPCIGIGAGGLNLGAWDGTVTQIGCSWFSGAGTPPAIPNAPVLKIS